MRHTLTYLHRCVKGTNSVTHELLKQPVHTELCLTFCIMMMYGPSISKPRAKNMTLHQARTKHIAITSASLYTPHTLNTHSSSTKQA